MFQHRHYQTLESNKQLKKLCVHVNGIKTAATIAGLITCPELQCNEYRLEALIHAFLSLSTDKKSPKKRVIIDAFSFLQNTPFDAAEDPAEDVFISLVSNSHGNFRIFEGLWECSAFYLQRFLEVIDEMPDVGKFIEIKNSVLGLLKISDTIIQKSGLDRYIIGNRYPLSSIPNELLDNLGQLKNRVKFTEQDLANLDIDLNVLKPFIIDLTCRDQLIKMEFGSSILEKQPIIIDNHCYYVMLPSAISVAIRQYMIDELSRIGMLPILLKQLSVSYERHFRHLHILGDLIRAPIKFFRNENTDFLISEVVIDIDKGRPLHLIFLVDDFTNNENGMLSQNLKGEDIGKELTERIKNAKKTTQSKSNFKDGISLIIVCGWGRTYSFSMPDGRDKNWQIESISASDITTLSTSAGFKSLTLWRLLYARDRLAEYGVMLHNINGLLNLYGWSKELGGHLVPHEGLPDTDKNGMFEMWINQNSLIDVRHEAYLSWDEHVKINPEGNPVRVSKKSISSYFKENSLIPLYVSKDDAIQRKLKAVYESVNRDWWCSISAPEEASSEVLFQLWEAAISWLHRAVRALERKFSTLSQDRIIWNLSFVSTEIPKQSSALMSYQDLKNLLSVSFDGIETIYVEFGHGFINGFRLEENYAERCMVWTLIKGIEIICDEHLSDRDREDVLDTIIPDISSKSLHMFSTKTFLDFVTNSLPKPIVINKYDDATLRIGLGWLARSREEGERIVGVEGCTQYLNKLVDELWREIKKLLKTIDRKQLIESLLLNIEAIRAEGQLWNRTIRACLAQHDDKNDVLQSASEKKYSLNGASLCSRVTIEMALCECPLEGGDSAGIIEISRMLAYSSLMHHIGGWSDAIMFKAMPAEIKISSVGEVMFDLSFERDIMTKFGNASQIKLLKSKANNYWKLFSKPKIAKSVEHLFDSDFNEAWLEEFGYSIDECRSYIDFLEDFALDQKKAVIEVKYTDLINPKNTTIEISSDTAKAILKSLTLWPRNGWPTTPPGFSKRDWEPWKFRRRLSLIARPLVKLDKKEDPTYFVAPALVREGFMYILQSYNEADFDEKQCKSSKSKMGKWIGTKRNFAGHEFNKKVAGKLVQFGWNAKPDVKLTEALNTKLDKNYGDIDVLAWRKDSGRVLIIECKNLEFAKTHGKIASQLNEFRGLNNKKGEPDRLKKHLKRIEILNSRLESLAKYMCLDKISSIETHLVFSNLAPIAFSKDDIFKNITITFFDSLEDI